jgi:hypothetical protein
MTKKELLVAKNIMKKKGIFDSISTNYLTLAKIGRSTSALQFLFMFNCITFASLFVASLLFVIYSLSFVILPVVLIHIHSILLDYFCFWLLGLFCFVRLFFVQLLSVIFCSDTGNVFQVF